MKTLLAAALPVLALLASTAAPAPARAAESYDACTGTIAALPATISTPGTWCVKQNLDRTATTGAAITVNANDVVIDCNGYKLDGAAAGVGTQAKGILAAGRNGITVRNCTLRGFQQAVILTGVSGGNHVVENNRVHGNTYSGIWVEGDGSVVRNNLVTLTGGSSVTPHAYGIYTRYVVDVAENTVSGVAASAGLAGNTIGVYTADNAGGTVVGNRIHRLVRNGTGTVRGVFNLNSRRMTLMRNTLAGDASTGSVGLSCTNNTSRAKDNVIGGFATALFLCGDAGRNDATP
jgi:parallel beta-helix repeat protein